MNARDSNKNMFTVDDLIYNMHHFEEENFERFDEIYAEVCSGDFSIEKDAVIRICRNFCGRFIASALHRAPSFHSRVRG